VRVERRLQKRHRLLHVCVFRTFIVPVSYTTSFFFARRYSGVFHLLRSRCKHLTTDLWIDNDVEDYIDTAPLVFTSKSLLHSDLF
jgi:hypothetical protein